jgi:DNA-binding LacI/PurR family transcriptional regulator
MPSAERTRQPGTRGAGRVTIKDVADAADVSVTTVSNVLNGRSSAMSANTHERVQQVMREMAFRPSRVARSLVHGRTATIGVVLAEIETPLFLQALNVMEPIARDAGYNILMVNARHAGDEQHVVGLLLAKEIDGVIFLSTSHYTQDTHLLPLHAAGVPVVLVNRATDADRFDRVDWDNAGGVESAVAHLVRLGHRHIAHLHGPADRRSTEERLLGYRRALVTRDIQFQDSYTFLEDYTTAIDPWHEAVMRLFNLATPPTAIVTSDDTVAAIVMRAIQRAGLRVPEDIALIGIDDQPFSAYLNPALTTVRLPILAAGEHAMGMLLKRMNGTLTQPEHIVLPCHLVVRESCGA